MNRLAGRGIAFAHTVSGLLKLLYPNREVPIAGEDLEWAVQLAIECRRRVIARLLPNARPRTVATMGWQRAS